MKTLSVRAWSVTKEWLCFGIFMLAILLPARGANLVTAMVTVTNTAGTTNGQTIVVNADTRTWTNSVSIPATQILTNNTAVGCATNLFNAIANAPFANLNLSWSSSNAVSLQTFPGGALTVTLSAGWGTVAYTTNALTTAQALRLPLSVESAGQQTNLASMLATGLESSSNVLSQTDVLLSGYQSLGQAQTVTGAKQITNPSSTWYGGVSNSPGIGGTAGFLTNGVYRTPILDSPTATNLVNRGNAISSAGATSFAEQFGAASTASGTASTALGYNSAASGANSEALGANSVASGGNSTASGYQATGQNFGDTALGTGATASGTNSTALGASTLVANGHKNSTAIGYLASTTAANQIMLGSSGISVVVNNALQVGAGFTAANGATNLLHTGTNNFPAGADVSFGRYALSSLANGANAAVPVGTNVFVEVSGPSGAFTINGINGQPNRDGKFLIVLNRTGQNLTIAHDSGVDATAANRIYCLTAADKTVTGNSAALLIYSGAVSRWILLNFAQ